MAPGRRTAHRRARVRSRRRRADARPRPIRSPSARWCSSTGCSNVASPASRLQYVLGSWGFRTLDLFLDRRVLIPRPETEVVGGHRDRRARSRASRARGARRARVVDLGTGSGRDRALDRRRARRSREVWATDLSADALEIARANLAGHRPTRATGDAARRRLVRRAARRAARHPRPRRVEPALRRGRPIRCPMSCATGSRATALVPGPTGLEAYERIVADATRWLVARRIARARDR